MATDANVVRATALKDEGNVAFKAAEYSKAISLYSRAIATAPHVAALYGCASPLTGRRLRPSRNTWALTVITTVGQGRTPIGEAAAVVNDLPWRRVSWQDLRP